MEELLKELAGIDARMRLAADYQKTLALLRALKAGTVDLAYVELLPDGWRVAAPAPPPGPELGDEDEARAWRE